MKWFILSIFSLVSLQALAQSKDTVSVWEGVASYYHPKFQGKKTSTGAIFDQSKCTAASNKIKAGSTVLVTNLKNGKQVLVLVNDKMSAQNKRLIDLSAYAAKEIGLYGKGLCKVRVELIQKKKAR